MILLFVHLASFIRVDGRFYHPKTDSNRSCILVHIYCTLTYACVLTCIGRVLTNDVIHESTEDLDGSKTVESQAEFNEDADASSSFTGYFLEYLTLPYFL